MPVNKTVLSSGEVLIDLTEDTVTEDTLAEGATAHNAAGEQITGKMVTSPTGDYIPVPATAEVGQTIRVSEVDENGKPTAWEAVDFPSGGGEWALINRITLEEETRIVAFLAEDTPWEYDELYAFLRAVPMNNAASKGEVTFQAFMNTTGNTDYHMSRITQAVWTGTTVINSGAKIFKPYASSFIDIIALRQNQMVTTENFGTIYNKILPSDGYIQRVLVYITDTALSFGVGTVLELWGRRK